MAASEQAKKGNSAEVQVPGSTSNLGPGFDCFGLALKLYLTIRAKVHDDAKEPCRVRTTGSRENSALPRNAANLIYRAMGFAARQEGIALPRVDLAVHNEIPLASGLGSSAAAIVGGIKLLGLLTGRELSDHTIQNYATEFEGHPDNVGASLYGGFVISSVDNDGEVRSIKFDWPTQVKVVVVSPQSQLPTHVARAALSRNLSRNDAVYNLQRTALFTGAVSQKRFDLLWDAMKDRIHQPQRQRLVPGLVDALALPKTSGLLGIALSGAGPSILALVDSNAEEIGKKIEDCFGKHQTRAATRIIEVDNDGCRVQTFKRAYS